MDIRIHSTFLPHDDPEAALAFYRDQLGFSVATDQPMGGGKRWIELRISHSQTRVVLFTPEGQEDRIGTFFNGSIACDDVEATCRQLQQRGVEFVEPPTTQPWGTFAKFKDSEDNVFVLSSS